MTYLSSIAKTVLLGTLCLSLVACNSSKKQRLQGDRIDAFAMMSDYTPSDRLNDTAVVIPQSRSITTWGMAGQNTSHNIGNMAFNGSVKPLWKSSIDGASDKTRIVAPVSDGSALFLMDEDHMVVAKDLKTGKNLWTFEPEIPEGDEDAFGGGLAVSKGRLVVGTPFGKLYTLDTSSGTLLWEKDGFLPFATGATITENNVGYISNIDNTLIAFDVTTGKKLWRHVGFRENSALFGGAAPAYVDGLILMGYSNGEFYAIREKDGFTLWSEGLKSILNKEGLNTIPHIRGLAVTHQNAVFATSHAGRTLALDMATGRTIWDKNIGSKGTPWLAGNMLYMTTIEGSIIAVHNRDGLVKWRTPIERFEDEEYRTDAIAWSEPVMAGGQLWVVNSLGELVTINPENGEITNRHNLGGSLYIAPMVVGDTMIVLENDGTIHALGKE